MQACKGKLVAKGRAKPRDRIDEGMLCDGAVGKLFGFEPLLAQGYAGATEIANRFTNVMGWSAVGDSVENWVYDGMSDTFIMDEDVRRRFTAANPHAAKAAVQRLLEANSRGLWQSDDATIAKLQEIYADIEDRIEGVVGV